MNTVISSYLFRYINKVRNLIRALNLYIMEKLTYLFNENDFFKTSGIVNPFKIYISSSGFFIISESGKIQLTPSNDEINTIKQYLNKNKINS